MFLFFFAPPRLQQEAAGNPDEEDKIMDLLEQAKALEAIAEQRTQELEDLMSNIGEFESKAAALDGWLGDSIKILKPKGNAPRPNRSKVGGINSILIVLKLWLSICIGNGGAW